MHIFVSLYSHTNIFHDSCFWVNCSVEFCAIIEYIPCVLVIESGWWQWIVNMVLMKVIYRFFKNKKNGHFTGWYWYVTEMLHIIEIAENTFLCLATREVKDCKSPPRFLSLRNIFRTQLSSASLHCCSSTNRSPKDMGHWKLMNLNCFDFYIFCSWQYL